MPSYLDLAVLAIVLVSAMLALLRGFTRETLAIFSWVAAGAAAYYFHPLALPYIRPHVPKENIAQAVAIAAVFFVALIVVSIVTVKVSDLILDSKSARWTARWGSFSARCAVCFSRSSPLLSMAGSRPRRTSRNG